MHDARATPGGDEDRDRGAGREAVRRSRLDLRESADTPPPLSSISSATAAETGDRTSLGTEANAAADDSDRSATATSTGERPCPNDDPEAALRDLGSLCEGAPVVHARHGVGRNAGFVRIALAEGEREFLAIDYAEGERVCVPLDALHLVAPHGLDDDEAPLHAIGDPTWPTLLRRAATEARAAAEALVARRESRRRGRAIRPDPAGLERFAAGFAHAPTADQKAAFDAVVADLAAPVPMDRLVCGDVGFGKTEVALRAAFAAVDAGYQVAVLAPTTLLARQHAERFAERFAAWPVRVGSLSRLDDGGEGATTLERLAAGEIDIVVGTHALLGDGVRFADLGLVIVDEEQRFGAEHKRRVTALRERIDTLTLSATPIPRTLCAGLVGLRDVSPILTPPPDRRVTETTVAERDERVLRATLARELARGGQAFVLHNAVDTIDAFAEELRALLPEAEIRVAHAQMPVETLESVFEDFVAHRFDVLVATTIIQNGIDVPNANTLVVDGAHALGLAQLHQLRGRVGRGARRARSLFLTPPRDTLTPAARRRLAALDARTGPGAGFALALGDLVIRGAGELLGDAQSGLVETLGVGLYVELIERAAQDLSSGREIDPERPFARRAEVALGVDAGLPRGYASDPAERLRLCKRVASATERDALDGTEREIVAAHGPLPPTGERLLRLARLRLLAEARGIVRLEADEKGMTLRFAADVAPDKAPAEAENAALTAAEDGVELRVARPLVDAAARLELAETLLRRIER